MNDRPEPCAKPYRSALYLPASNQRAIEKARGLPVDVVILDLEDAVAPQAKGEARLAAVAAVAAGGFRAGTLVLRVNGLDTPWGTDDLAAAAELDIAAVLVPKICDAHDIGRYDAALHHARPGVALWAMVETCRAVSQLQPIADRSADTRLSGLVMGCNDLLLEMRAHAMPARANLMPVLTLAVAAARSQRLVVFDGVCNDFTDIAAFQAEAAQGLALGFDGKSLIHPAQIDPCNAVFSPSAEEVARARGVVQAFAHPDNEGKGAIRLDGRMVERLHLAEAARLLAIAEAIGTPG